MCAPDNELQLYVSLKYILSWNNLYILVLYMDLQVVSERHWPVKVLLIGCEDDQYPPDKDEELKSYICVLLK